MRPPTSSGRNAERVTLDAMVLVRSVVTDRVFRTRDVSATGCFIFTKVTTGAPFEVGQAVELQLTGNLDGRNVAIRCQGEIARAVEPGTAEADAFPTGLGVRITSCAASDRAQLERLVAAQRN